MHVEPTIRAAPYRPINHIHFWPCQPYMFSRLNRYNWLLRVWRKDPCYFQIYIPDFWLCHCRAGQCYHWALHRLAKLSWVARLLSSVCLSQRSITWTNKRWLTKKVWLHNEPHVNKTFDTVELNIIKYWSVCLPVSHK